MKRYYIIHESDWESPVEFMYSSGSLWQAFEGKGCAWWDLGNGMRLVCGDFKDEDREHVWNSHQAVTHLHHPVKEKALPLSDLFTAAHTHKRFTQRHMDALAAVGAVPSDTLVSLNQKVAAVHPGCAIFPIPKPESRWIY